MNNFYNFITKNFREKCILFGMLLGLVGLILLDVWVRQYTGPFWANLIFG